MNYEYCDGYTYTIKNGDTLYEISRSHKVPLSLLLRSNPFVDVFNLQVGDTLCIPTRQAPPRPCEMWGNCEDGLEMPENPDRPSASGMPGNPDRPSAPGMPGNPNIPNVPGMSGTPDRPNMSGTPDRPVRPGMQQMPGGSGETEMPGTQGTLQPSETLDNDVEWERYVVKPGDTMSKILGGNMAYLNAFGERNGWNHVYLLPGVAYFVPEEN